MSVPEGVKAPAPGMCVKLRRSIYGLKQAGRSWNERLHNTMTQLGFRRSKADPCLYLDDTDSELITINIHVDDCCLTYDSESKFRRFKEKLKKEFRNFRTTTANQRSSGEVNTDRYSSGFGQVTMDFSEKIIF